MDVVYWIVNSLPKQVKKHYQYNVNIDDILQVSFFHHEEKGKASSALEVEIQNPDASSRLEVWVWKNLAKPIEVRTDRFNQETQKMEEGTELIEARWEHIETEKEDAKSKFQDLAEVLADQPAT